MAKNPGKGADPLTAFFKSLKNIFGGAPHSGDDQAAQAETAAVAGHKVQVKPVKFSAQSRAALSVLALRAQVDAIAPHRSIASDGILGDDNHKKTKSDHNPWVMDGASGVVTAIDITHDPDRDCDAGLLAEALVASRDPRIKYIIYNSRIISAEVNPWVWRAYAGANKHTLHVHVSVQTDKSLYDDTTAWNLSLMTGGKKPAKTPKVIGSPPSAVEPVAAGASIAWGRKVSPAFKAKVIAIAERLRLDANWLMAVMAFETGRSFNPAEPNRAGSGAIGLIQFMPKTATYLGTTTAALAAMTAVDQLDYVEKHFKPNAGKMATLASAYMAVLLPSAVAKPDSHVLFAAPSKAYKLNAGLDADDDGKITKAEAAAKVQAALVEGMRPENFG